MQVPDCIVIFLKRLGHYQHFSVAFGVFVHHQLQFQIILPYFLPLVLKLEAFIAQVINSYEIAPFHSQDPLPDFKVPVRQVQSYCTYILVVVSNDAKLVVLY